MKKTVSYIVATAILLSVGFFCGCKETKDQHPKVVSVMIYDEYIDPEMITDFQMKTGYKLQLELYEAQEEMISKLQATSSSNYDVIIASDVVIQQMIQLGLIAPIDTSKIPNRVNIAAPFQNPTYDPSNTYTVPYLWGTTGILYRDTTLSEDSVSYSMLFDSRKTKKHFSLLDEARSMLSMALLARGYSANSVRPEEINEAINIILEAKKDSNFLSFEGSEIGKEKVISGINWAAVVFNGEAMDAINEDPTLRYAIPIEGSFMWVDAMTLSSKAKNINGAHAFMNYILDAENGAKLAKTINFATPNMASLDLIGDSFKNNRVINPTKNEMDRMVFLKDPGIAARFFEDAWNIVKAR